MSAENLRKVYGDDPTSWPTGANRSLPRGPGPLSHGDDEDAAELRRLNQADREQERADAEEIGATVAELRQLMAEQAAHEADVARKTADGTYAREYAAEQAALRRAVGVPDGALPGAVFGRANGGIVTRWRGYRIDGPFALDAAGNPIGPGVRRERVQA